jgi:hypothetical protein
MQETGKELGIDEVRAELTRLETEEARLSAVRRHLQHQIDFGFESSTTREREREVSSQRLELHRRIDSLREILRAQADV